MLINEVQRKNFEGIKIAVNQGADVDTMIWDEWPCVHRVALFGMDDALLFLIEQGANINIHAKQRKPLYWAASEGHEAICCLLLDHEDKTGLVSKPAP